MEPISTVSGGSIEIPTDINGWDYYESSGRLVAPSGTTQIADNGFAGCTGLKNVTICGDITSIGTYAFTNCTAMTSMAIPEGVTTLGNVVFWKCTALTTVTLPRSLTTVGAMIFNGCDKLNTINFGGSKKEWEALIETTGNGMYSPSQEVTINFAITEQSEINGEAENTNGKCQIYNSARTSAVSA